MKDIGVLGDELVVFEKDTINLSAKVSSKSLPTNENKRKWTRKKNYVLNFILVNVG